MFSMMMQRARVSFFLAAVIFLLGILMMGSDLAHGEESCEKAEMTSFELAPFVLDGKTYVPVRELAGHVGMHVSFDQGKNLIIVEDGQIAYSFKKTADQPGRAVEVGTKDEQAFPYYMEKGRLFIPLRYLADHFAWNITWEPCRKAVLLNSGVNNGNALSLQFAVEEPFARKLWPTPGRVAYLTFDDGPSDTVTPHILDILREEKVKATFFVVGERVKRHPELLERIHEEGHTIGNHTYSHQPEVIFSGVGAFMQEIRKAEAAIQAVIGERPKLVRMPYGTNFPTWPQYRQALERNGYTHVSWNVNSFDALRKNVPADRIVREVKRQTAGKDKVIILFHDLVSITTAEALPEVIQYLKGQGYFIWPL